jgi:predicted dehydrogenase
VAICDISRAALDRFGNEYGVAKRYARLDTWLADEEIDIAIVSTWGTYHAEVSNTIARSGHVRAILVEKPISSTVAECEEMIGIARDHGVLLTEGYKFRYHPQHIRAKEVLDSGRIGAVRSIQCALSSPLIRYAPRDNWRFHRERGGGSVFDTASYLIHFARYIVGVEPCRVYAVGSYVDFADAEVSASILLEFPNGVVAKLTSSYEYGYCQATAILGSQGWIRMDLPFDQRSVREVEFVEKEELPATVQVYRDNFDTEVYRFTPVNQFEAQLQHLCACLDGDSIPLISPEFSLGNMRAIEATLESIRTGQVVAVQ